MAYRDKPQKRASAVGQGEAYHALLFHELSVPVVVCDMRWNVLAFNKAAGQLLGIDVNGTTAEPLSRIFANADELIERAEHEILAEQEAPYTGVLTGDMPNAPRVGVWVKSGAQDGTAYRFLFLRSLVRSTDTSEELPTLRAEYQNRLRNAITTIRYLATFTADNARSLEDFQSRFHDRIDVVSGALAMVGYKGSGWIELADLVLETLGPYHVEEGKDFDIVGPPVILNASTATMFMICVSELAFHSIEHGVLGDEGQLEVRWRYGDGPAAEPQQTSNLVFTWKELGAPTLRPDSEFDLGVDLITQGLPYELGAETKFYQEDNASVFEFSIPVRYIKQVGEGHVVEFAAHRTRRGN
jgi:two-component sensor histidine kinase